VPAVEFKREAPRNQKNITLEGEIQETKRGLERDLIRGEVENYLREDVTGFTGLEGV